MLHPGEIPRQTKWILLHQPKLDGGKIETLVRFFRHIHIPTASIEETIRIEAAYFERNAERMRYPKFRRKHLFIGSGVVEAGCKNVIGARLKRSGIFWTVNGAIAIIALRYCHLNSRMENYWASRRAA